MAKDRSNQGAGALIGAVCSEKKISLTTLSRNSGIPEDVLSRYIRGEQVPRTQTLSRICYCLGLTVEEFQARLD